MLIEVKVKVARIIDGKARKRTETFVIDKEVFAEAELAVIAALSEEQNDGYVDAFEIQSLRISPIKEVCTQWLDPSVFTFIATLKDTFHADDGTEKTLRYKVLLWAGSHAEALSNVQQLARQGYDMQIEGIKQVDYEYLTPQEEQDNE